MLKAKFFCYEVFQKLGTNFEINTDLFGGILVRIVLRRSMQKVNESHCPLPRTWSFRLWHICDTEYNFCNVLKLTRFRDIIKRLMILPNLMTWAVSSTGKRVETFLSCIFTESTTEQSLDVTTAEQDRLSEPLDTTSVFDDGTTISDAVTSTSDTLIADVVTSTSDTSTGEFVITSVCIAVVSNP